MPLILQGEYRNAYFILWVCAFKNNLNIGYILINYENETA